MSRKNILIVYSSREATGNSKKIAEALAGHFGEQAVLSSAGNAPDPSGFAYVIMGFGIYHGWPDGDMRAFMRRCKSVPVGLFLTLGAYPDSDHAKSCMGRAEGLLQSCLVRGRFMCHGRLDPALIERMKNRASGPHSWNEERARRIDAAETRPDANDFERAIEIFSEGWKKVSNPPTRSKVLELRSGIVLASFGTTREKAAAAYCGIEQQLRTENPGVELRWAYTSKMVRDIRQKRGAAEVKSVPDVLNEMLIDGFTDVTVVPTNVVPGEEYHKLASDVAAFHNGALKFNSLKLSAPLLKNGRRLKEICKILLDELPGSRQPEDAVLFMGHGNESGRCDMHYLAAAAELNRLDGNVYLASVEGVPDFFDVRDELLERKYKRVWLLPFMIVAGDHAVNDLAGDDADSWKSMLSSDGIECHTVLKGLGEYERIARLFAVGMMS